MAKKAKDAFRTISEVASWLDVEAHVLRFWESKFPQIKPVKRKGGRRYYRPSDMRLIGGIKTMLHDQGVTIRGVQLKLKEDGIEAVSNLSQPVTEDDAAPRPKPKIIQSTPTPEPEITPEPDPPADETPPDDHEALAPFIDVPEDTRTGGDNVVEMSSRERRRADLEAQASQLDLETKDFKPSHAENPPEPEPVDVNEPETPAPQAPTEPDPEPQPAPIAAESMPDFSQVNASQIRRESLETITQLRRWDPSRVQNREQIQYLEHRVRTLRERMAAALKRP